MSAGGTNVSKGAHQNVVHGGFPRVVHASDDPTHNRHDSEADTDRPTSSNFVNDPGINEDSGKGNASLHKTRQERISQPGQGKEV